MIQNKEMVAVKVSNSFFLRGARALRSNTATNTMGRSFPLFKSSVQ